MGDPRLALRAEFETLRGRRPLPAVFGSLWTCGDLTGLARPTVALVGTRAASAYGRTAAYRFAAALGEAGCCIISGLALGIDTAAHEGALDAGAPTIGVLGGGHLHFFPRRNRDLARRMVECAGAVLSPYDPSEPARPGQFLQRNGVVAALADAVVVIEAPARSGALNTAGWAAGRIPVFAVPGDIDRPHAAGCHALIRDGATLARGPDDVADELGLCAKSHEPSRLPVQLTDPLQATIVEFLGEGERSLEEIHFASGEPISSVLAALSLLEMRELIEPRGGLRYALRR